MAWSARDMNPNMNPDQLLATGVMGKERVITDFILPAMRDVAPLFSTRQPTDASMRAYAEKALTQGFSVEVIVSVVKTLADKFDRFPPWYDFACLLRAQTPAKESTSFMEPSPWYESLCKTTSQLIEEHGREKVEELAERYSQGVYQKPLNAWGDFKENIIRLFVHDRMAMGQQSSMEQVINYAVGKLKLVDERPQKATVKNPPPYSYIDKTATVDNF